MNRTASLGVAMAAAFVLFASAGLAADPCGSKADTKSEAGKVASAPAVRQVFPLKFANAKDLAIVITELFAMPTATGQNRHRFGGFGGRQPAGTSEEPQSAARGTVAADDQSNSLIVSATEEDLRVVGEIVAKIDTSLGGVANIRSFRLQHADAVELAEILRELYADTSIQNRRNPNSSRQGQTKAAAVGNPRTNSLIIVAARETMAEIAEMIGRLDATDGRRQRVYVRSLEHADPDSVAKVLREMLSDEGAQSPEPRPARSLQQSGAEVE